MKAVIKEVVNLNRLNELAIFYLMCVTKGKAEWKIEKSFDG